jgi:hypothetical protein
MTILLRICFSSLYMLPSTPHYMLPLYTSFQERAGEGRGGDSEKEREAKREGERERERGREEERGKKEGRERIDGCGVAFKHMCDVMRRHQSAGSYFCERKSFLSISIFELLCVRPDAA